MSTDNLNPDNINTLPGFIAGVGAAVLGVILRWQKYLDTKAQEQKNQTEILEELSKQRLSIAANASTSMQMVETQKEFIRLIQELKEQGTEAKHFHDSSRRDQERIESAIRELSDKMNEGMLEIHRRMDMMLKRG